MTDQAGAKVDGRRARGHRTRTDIIAATLAIIEREGVAGVTHRTVAAQAGVPPGSVTYHFATLDDLLVAALTTAVDDYARQLDRVVAEAHDPLAGLAHLIVDAAGPGRQRALAERELTLFAARRPALRPAAQRWRDIVAAIAARYSADPRAGSALVAASDGVCTRVLLEDENALTTAEIHQQLRHALHLDRPTPAAPAVGTDR